MVPAVAVASVGMGGAGMAVAVRTLALPLVGDTIAGARRFVRSDDDNDGSAVGFLALVATAATVFVVVVVVR